MEKKKADTYIRRSVLVIAVIVFLYSGGRLISIYMEYKAGKDEYNKLEQLVLQETTALVQATTILETPSTPIQETGMELGSEVDATTAIEATVMNPVTTTMMEATTPGLKYVDFDTLISLNPDTKGWITLYGTKINYPVVQAADNGYYLDTTFSGNNNSAGAIFMDCNIKDGMEGKNVIIYGHNMKNGSMFGTLSYYKRAEMLKSYPAFEIHTADGTYEYAIFAAFLTTASSDTYTYAFASEESFMSYIDRMKNQSLYDTGVNVTKEDKIITLSTCSGDGDDRFVVLAKRAGIK